MTMIDGKVFRVIAESSSQKCGICGDTPTMMNDLNAVKNRSCNTNMFEYGLSTCVDKMLWMHFTNCLPNAYKKWQIRDCDKHSSTN